MPLHRYSLLDQSSIAELFDSAARARFGRFISAAALSIRGMELDQESTESSRPPPCPGCKRTMRLTDRKTNPDGSKADILTFECDCGQVATATMNH